MNIMKRTTILRSICASALWCLTAGLATTVDLKSPIVAFSADKKYKFEVLPPRFQNDISYSFFQADDFLHLTHSESAEIARTASITGNLYQEQKGTYVLIWSRPLVSTIIPSRAFVLATDTDNIVVGVDGQRREASDSNPNSYFAIYRFNGSCLTNGYYSQSKINTWSLTNQIVELKDHDGHTRLKVNINN